MCRLRLQMPYRPRRRTRGRVRAESRRGDLLLPPQCRRPGPARSGHISRYVHLVTFADYKNELYMAGELPAFTTDPVALEESARQRMEPGPFWYVAGAAGTGAT